MAYYCVDGRQIKLRGRVAEVAYYVNEGHVYLENATGVPVTVNVPNDTRRSDRAIAIGDALWIAWSPADTLVLTR